MPSDPDIRQLIDAGQKIEAIKLYRERYGVGLHEAKEAIDAAAAGGALAPPPTGPSADPSPDAWAAVDQALRQGNKLEAIRLYRERTGVGLKEAKDAVEARAVGVPADVARGGCFIATAAYGSPLAPEVAALRAFRDRALAPRPWGRRLVGAYNRLSPPVARIVARSTFLRSCVRRALGPLARFLERR